MQIRNTLPRLVLSFLPMASQHGMIYLATWDERLIILIDGFWSVGVGI